MIDAVIFDVDGTLVDTVDFHAEAWQRAFSYFGKSFDLRAIRSQIGKGGDQLMPVFLSDEETETLGPRIEAFRKRLLEDDYLPKVQAFPGVAELMAAIHARGRKIALASSAKADELEVYTRAARITGVADAETTADDAEKTKPYPDIFEAALMKLGLSPERTLVIGDTPYDADAAQRAGIASIGVLCGGFPADDIRLGGAQAIYRDPGHLLETIDIWLT